MTETIKLKRKDVKDLLKQVFPDYKGRKITLRMQEYYNYNSIDSYWSGGSKTVTRVLTINGDNINVQGPNEMNNPITMDHGSQKIELNDNVIVMTRQYFGTSQYIDIYVSKNSLLMEKFQPKLLN